MKDNISDHQILLIRACKKNKTSIRTLRRIVGIKCALAFLYVDKNHVAYSLMQIVDDYNLINNWKEFILRDLNPKKWWTSEVKDYTDNLIEQLISIIANSEISKFPRYHRPLRFRIKYPD